MGKIKLAVLAALLGALMGAFALVGCGQTGDAQYFQGEWQIEDTEVTVVFTQDQFKTAASSFEYSVDAGAKTVTFKSGSMTGGGSYEFSEDKKTLTLEETNADGNKEKTKFIKLSDDVTKEPSAGPDVDLPADSPSSESAAG